MPIIIKNRCVGCGVCAAQCPNGVIEINNEGTAEIKHPEKCTKCGNCIKTCGLSAIKKG